MPRNAAAIIACCGVRTAGVSLSPDGARAAVVIENPSGNPDVWIYEIAENLRTRFTFGAQEKYFPIWSPDGDELVFSSNRKGQLDLYRKSLGGSADEELLLESEAIKYPSSWSPDGRLLSFFQQGEGTNFDIWILPLDGEREPYPFLRTPFGEAQGVFSPDGRWMAYESDASGRAEVYVTPFPGPGRKWQISTGGGEWPRWRGDGKEVFYHGHDGTLTAVEVSSRDETFVVGPAKGLFKMKGPVSRPHWDATGDGQRFLTVRPERAEEPRPLSLVVNWTAELRRE